MPWNKLVLFNYCKVRLFVKPIVSAGVHLKCQAYWNKLEAKEAFQIFIAYYCSWLNSLLCTECVLLCSILYAARGFLWLLVGRISLRKPVSFNYWLVNKPKKQIHWNFCEGAGTSLWVLPKGALSAGNFKECPRGFFNVIRGLEKKTLYAKAIARKCKRVGKACIEKEQQRKDGC